MSAAIPRVRADAERSTARILEAAETVLADDVNAPLERIADEAGLARATVHRRFTSRKALLAALAERLNDRYLTAIEDARVESGPPRVALHCLAEIIFELKITYRFTISQGPALADPVRERLCLLFDRLLAAQEITATDPVWSLRIFTALIHEVHELPADSPMLAGISRAELLVSTTLRALGGKG